MYLGLTVVGAISSNLKFLNEKLMIYLKKTKRKEKETFSQFWR
jgi:hypothetical protein